jgi:hypothetical protein
MRSVHGDDALVDVAVVSVVQVPIVQVVGVACVLDGLVPAACAVGVIVLGVDVVVAHDRFSSPRASASGVSNGLVASPH